MRDLDAIVDLDLGRARGKLDHDVAPASSALGRDDLTTDADLRDHGPSPFVDARDIAGDLNLVEFVGLLAQDLGIVEQDQALACVRGLVEFVDRSALDDRPPPDDPLTARVSIATAPDHELEAHRRDPSFVISLRWLG